MEKFSLYVESDEHYYALPELRSITNEYSKNIIPLSVVLDWIYDNVSPEIPDLIQKALSLIHDVKPSGEHWDGYHLPFRARGLNLRIEIEGILNQIFKTASPNYSAVSGGATVVNKAAKEIIARETAKIAISMMDAIERKWVQQEPNPKETFEKIKTKLTLPKSVEFSTPLFLKNYLPAIDGLIYQWWQNYQNNQMTPGEITVLITLRWFSTIFWNG